MKKVLSNIFITILLITILVPYTSTQLLSVSAAKNSEISVDSSEKDSDKVWPDSPKIFGTTGVLIEASTGTVLYSKKSEKKMYPASITKIMTALLTIENCKLDETVVFSEKAVNSLNYDDANFGCKVGEKMSVKDCLYVLMLKSANEVATALGEHIAGSTEKFADMMNERAKKAGALHTNFCNANGLHDPNHYVTAYDMAMITRAAAQYDLFNEIVNTTSYKVSTNNKRKTRDIANQRHRMVWPTSNYYYKGIIGGKTGYTDQSGTTLVTYAKRNGMTLIAVVLQSNGINVYEDTKKLLDYGFNNFNLLNVSKNDKRFSESEKLTLQTPFSTSSESIYIDKNSNIVIPKSTDFSKVTSTIDFSLSENSFGTITYKLGKKVIGTAEIKYESTSFTKTTTENKTKIASEKNTDNTNAKAEDSSSDKKESGIKFKFSKLLLTIIVIFIIVVILILFIVLQKRRINKIRNYKRRRKY